MTPEAVTPAALYLVSDSAPRRTILSAVAGGYSRIVIGDRRGIPAPGRTHPRDRGGTRFTQIADLTTASCARTRAEPGFKFVKKAAEAAGVKLG